MDGTAEGGGEGKAIPLGEGNGMGAELLAYQGVSPRALSHRILTQIKLYQVMSTRPPVSPLLSFQSQ